MVSKTISVYGTAEEAEQMRQDAELAYAANVSMAALGGLAQMGSVRAANRAMGGPIEPRPQQWGAPVDPVPAAGGVGPAPTPGASPTEYAARAQELLKAAVRPQQQAQTTIDVGPAVDPSGKSVTLISATVDIDASHLKAGEVLVPYSGGHAEIQKMRFAIEKGYKVLYVNPSIPLCPTCALQARQAGLALPGAMVSQGSGKPALPLDTLSNADLSRMAAEQAKPAYKTHERVPWRSQERSHRRR